jgi:hypothetical protein
MKSQNWARLKDVFLFTAPCFQYYWNKPFVHVQTCNLPCLPVSSNKILQTAWVQSLSYATLL